MDLEIIDVKKLQGDVVRLHFHTLESQENEQGSIEINAKFTSIQFESNITLILSKNKNEVDDCDYAMKGNVVSIKNDMLFCSFGGLLCNIPISNYNFEILEVVYLGLNPKISK